MGVADVEQGTHAPGELTQPALRGFLVAACPCCSGQLCCSLRCRAPSPAPPAAAVRPRNSADLRWHTRAETSSAKTAPASSKKADTLDKTAPAPYAAQTYGQVVQPGFPVVPCERPANTPITHGEAESCCNVQWVLFVVGFFFVPASYAGAALPLCLKPSFPTRCHKCAHPLERRYLYGELFL